MDTIIESLSRQLGPQATSKIGQALGVKEEQAETAMSAALPMLLGGLARNSSRPEGAGALLAALDKDHDGSILDDVGGFLGQGSGAASSGAGILKHVFGGRQRSVESAIGKVSGIDAGSASQLLGMLAPLVLGALGRAKKDGGLDAGGLASLLGREESVLKQSSSGGMDMLTRLLDSDDDGSVMDDLAKMGSSLLGSLRRK